ncbi:MAG: YARHG domain-containing protein [Acutalibacteraceae bacterium]
MKKITLLLSLVMILAFFAVPLSGCDNDNSKKNNTDSSVAESASYAEPSVNITSETTEATTETTETTAEPTTEAPTTEEPTTVAPTTQAQTTEATVASTAPKKTTQKTTSKSKSNSTSSKSSAKNKTFSYSTVSSRLLTQSEVKGVSYYNLQCAINEVYARHGYIFHDQAWKDMFESKSWYEPVSNNQNKIEKTFSKIEKQNIDTMRIEQQK